MTTEPTGLIAILRGLTPAEAPAIGEALYTAGFRKIEVLRHGRQRRGMVHRRCQLLGATGRTAPINRGE